MDVVRAFDSSDARGVVLLNDATITLIPKGHGVVTSRLPPYQLGGENSFEVDVHSRNNADPKTGACKSD